MDTKKLKQKILDLAIHGKLVPQDPNDEPASALLARIREEKLRLIKEGKIKKAKKSDTSDTACCENVPFDVPEGWAICKLEECFSFIRNGANIKQNKISIGYPITRIETISNEIIDRSKMGYAGIVDEGYASYYLKTNDILMSHINSAIHVGKSALCVIKEGEKIIHGMNLLCLRPFEELDAKYLHLFFKTNVFKDRIKPFVKNAVNQASINIRNLGEISIPLPPLSEQHRIVAEIEKWFTLIDTIESSKTDLQTSIKQAKSKILDLAICGKLVPQDPGDEPAAELLKRINPKAQIATDIAHYGKVASGWCLAALKDVTSIVTGSTPSKNDNTLYGNEFPFIKPSDLDSGRHVCVASEYLSDKGKACSRVIPSGSTAICCIGTIGKAGYLECQCTTNQQINSLIPSQMLDSVYLYYLCSSTWFTSVLESMSSAVTISIVNKGKMSAIAIPIPPLAEQKRIVSKIEALFNTLDAIAENL